MESRYVPLRTSSLVVHQSSEEANYNVSNSKGVYVCCTLQLKPKFLAFLGNRTQTICIVTFKEKV